MSNTKASGQKKANKAAKSKIMPEGFSVAGEMQSGVEEEIGTTQSRPSKEQIEWAKEKATFFTDLGIEEREFTSVIQGSVAAWKTLIDFLKSDIYQYGEALASLQKADKRIRGMSRPKTKKAREKEPHLFLGKYPGHQQVALRAIKMWAPIFEQHRDDAVSSIRQATKTVEGIKDLFQDTLEELKPLVELTSISEESTAAMMVRQKLKEKKIRPIDYIGALVMHYLKYESFPLPPTGRTTDTCSVVARFYQRARKTEKSLKKLFATCT